LLGVRSEAVSLYVPKELLVDCHDTFRL
jgi:hypothetical protein